jgi:predicted O-linked N-acetylglucosamine transferase (SPINDLY family)
MGRLSLSHSLLLIVSQTQASSTDALNALNAHAHHLLAQGSLQAAITAFREVLTVMPAHPQALQGAVAASMQAKRWDWAAELAERWLSAAGTSPVQQTEALAHVVLARLVLGEYQAVSDYINAEIARYCTEHHPHAIQALRLLCAAAADPLQAGMTDVSAPTRTALHSLLQQLGADFTLALRASTCDAELFAAMLMAEQAGHCNWQSRSNWLALLDKLSHRDTLDWPAGAFWSMAVGPDDAVHARHARLRYHAARSRAPTLQLRDYCYAPYPRALRVAYVSSRLDRHATSVLMHRLPAAHDRNAVSVHIYQVGPYDQTDLIDAIERGSDSFTAVSDDAAAIANALQRDRIDVMIAMPDADSRPLLAACAAKPVPVTINYLSFGGSLGGACDYRIAGPSDSAQLRCDGEHWLRFTKTPFVYSASLTQKPGRDTSASDARAALGLPAAAQGATLLAAFNSAYKLSAPLCEAWARLLHAEPRAMLWLLASESMVKPQLTQWFARRGIGSDRLLFFKPQAHNEYLASCRLADLYLDAWDCSGNTTLLDMLEANVPPVVLHSSRLVNAIATDILNSVGLSQCIATSPAEYVEKALEFLRNSGQRQAISQHLRDSRHRYAPFDISMQARRLERACHAAYARYAAALPPADIDIE